MMTSSSSAAAEPTSWSSAGRWYASFTKAVLVVSAIAGTLDIFAAHLHIWAASGKFELRALGSSVLQLHRYARPKESNFIPDAHPTNRCKMKDYVELARLIIRVLPLGKAVRCASRAMTDLRSYGRSRSTILPRPYLDARIPARISTGTSKCPYPNW